MEEKLKEKYKGPLPEDRQGSSGADAGRVSMRDIGQMGARDVDPPNIDIDPQESTGNQNEATRIDPNSQHQNPSREQIANVRNTKIPWDKNEYIELMRCYFHAQLKGNFSERKLFDIWRQRNPTKRPSMTSKTLSNQRRFIVNTKKLTDLELDKIKEDISKEINEGYKDTKEVTETEVMQRKDLGKQTGVTQHITTQPFAPDTTQSPIGKQILETFQMIRSKELSERIHLPSLKESIEVKRLIGEANGFLTTIVQDQLTLTNIRDLTYSVALVITKQFVKLKEPKLTNHANVQQIPRWKERLKSKIKKLRSELSLLTQHHNIKTAKAKKNLRTIEQKHKIKKAQDYINTTEMLKQKIKLYAERIRRYEKRVAFFKDNSEFENNCSTFFRRLNNCGSNTKPTLDIGEVEEFWGNIWEKSPTHNRGAKWMEREESRVDGTTFMEMQPITLAMLRQSLSKLPNWKAAGPDLVANFWMKKLTSLH